MEGRGEGFLQKRREFNPGGNYAQRIDSLCLFNFFHSHVVTLSSDLDNTIICTIKQCHTMHVILHGNVYFAFDFYCYLGDTTSKI